jgi:hypothetical protein
MPGSLLTYLVTYSTFFRSFDEGPTKSNEFRRRSNQVQRPLASLLRESYQLDVHKGTFRICKFRLIRSILTCYH